MISDWSQIAYFREFKSKKIVFIFRFCLLFMVFLRQQNTKKHSIVGSFNNLEI